MFITAEQIENVAVASALDFNAGDYESVLVMLRLRRNIHCSYIATETNYKLDISD